MAIDINQVIHDANAVASEWLFIFFLILAAVSCTIMFRNKAACLGNGAFAGAAVTIYAIYMGEPFSIFWAVWLYSSFAVFGILASILKRNNIKSSITGQR